MSNPLLVALLLVSMMLGAAGAVFHLVSDYPDSGNDASPTPTMAPQLFLTGDSLHCSSGAIVRDSTVLKDGKFAIVGDLKDFENSDFKVESPAGVTTITLAVDADVEGHFMQGDAMSVQGAVIDGKWVATAVAHPCGNPTVKPTPSPKSTPSTSQQTADAATAAPAATHAAATAVPIPATPTRAATPPPTPAVTDAPTPLPNTPVATAPPTPPAPPAATPVPTVDSPPAVVN